MVMTRPPAFHVCKFLMKNMIPTNSGLINNLKNYHDQELELCIPFMLCYDINYWPLESPAIAIY